MNCRLASRVDEFLGESRINLVDIGGGVSMNYDSDIVRPSFQEYFDEIHKVCPNFFFQKRTVVTEFGRAYVGKAGAIVTIIEDVIEPLPIYFNSPLTAITHAGADLFPRTVGH